LSIENCAQCYQTDFSSDFSGWARDYFIIGVVWHIPILARAELYIHTNTPIKEISGVAIQTMSMDKWAAPKSTQLSTKVWVKLLLLLEHVLKVHF